MSESKSPFKKKPEFEDDTTAAVSYDAQSKSYYQRLVDSVWPDTTIEPPHHPSLVKTGSVPIKDQQVPIMDHLWVVKCHLDTLCMRGQINNKSEHYLIVLESVQVTALRDWLKKILPLCKQNASNLLPPSDPPIPHSVSRARGYVEVGAAARLH